SVSRAARPMGFDAPPPEVGSTRVDGGPASGRPGAAGVAAALAEAVEPGACAAPPAGAAEAHAADNSASQTEAIERRDIARHHSISQTVLSPAPVARHVVPATAAIDLPVVRYPRPAGPADGPASRHPDVLRAGPLPEALGP